MVDVPTLRSMKTGGSRNWNSVRRAATVRCKSNEAIVEPAVHLGMSTQCPMDRDLVPAGLVVVDLGCHRKSTKPVSDRRPQRCSHDPPHTELAAHCSRRDCCRLGRGPRCLFVAAKKQKYRAVIRIR